MRKNAKQSDGREAGERGQLWLRLPGLVREALYDTVIGTCPYREFDPVTDVEESGTLPPDG